MNEATSACRFLKNGRFLYSGFYCIRSNYSGVDYDCSEFLYVMLSKHFCLSSLLVLHILFQTPMSIAMCVGIRNKEQSRSDKEL